MRNLVAALFRLETSRDPEHVLEFVGALVEWLQAPEQADLRRAFAVWLRRVFPRERDSDVEIPETENLQEVRTMLAERVKEWSKRWHEEGRQEGRQEGGADLLTRQLERKFGGVDEAVRDRIAHADSNRLVTWGERVLTAQSLEEVFR
jgi:hypothetical protein